MDHLELKQGLVRSAGPLAFPQQSADRQRDGQHSDDRGGAAAGARAPAAAPGDCGAQDGGSRAGGLALTRGRCLGAHAGRPPQIALDIDVNHVISVAELAGQAIMDIYESEADAWDVNHKTDDSPLTKADTEANRIICSALMERTPHIPIISEENKLDDYARRQVGSRVAGRGSGSRVEQRRALGQA